MADYFIMLSVCPLVKGYSRTAIYDIQREAVDFLPNDLYDFAISCNKKSLSDIKEKYIEYWDIVEEYIDYLVDNEYAIIGSSQDILRISDISSKYAYYGVITNCICDYSEFNNQNIQLISSKLSLLGCSAFQLLSLQEKISIGNLKKILISIEEIRLLHHVELIIPYNDYSVEDIDILLHEHPLINRCIIHTTPFNEIRNKEHTIMIFTKQIVNSCGIVNKNYFSLNLHHVTESQNYNTCLNRKLSIDKDGNIKNCPFSDETFGNILTSDLTSVIESQDFQKMWHITKDEITVCKDCEFRYVCTDCRVFVKDSNDIYSQPAKCKYNPYIGKWEGEEEFCSVEESLKKIGQ